MSDNDRNERLELLADELVERLEAAIREIEATQAPQPRPTLRLVVDNTRG